MLPGGAYGRPAVRRLAWRHALGEEAFAAQLARGAGMQPDDLA
jgi:hypothetical protein